MGRTHYRPYSGQGWATNFTCFRWTIPEVAGFAGRAVYVDADQTIHGDIRELQETNLQGKCCAVRKGVIVFDCAHPFWREGHWPPLDAMRKSGAGLGVYQACINQHGGGSCLFPETWDNLDGKNMDPYKAKLNHYTAMEKQPYFPFPDRFRYPEQHPVVGCSSIFWESYRDALGERLGVEPRKFSRWRNTRKQCWEMEAELGLNMFGRPAGYPYYFTDMREVARLSAQLNPWLPVVL